LKLSTSNNKTNQELTDQELTDQELTDFLDQQDLSESKEEIKDLVAYKFHNYKSLMLPDKKLLEEKELMLHHNGKLAQDQKEQLTEMQEIEIIQMSSISEETNVMTQKHIGKLI
jgi:hypothetical protein